MYPRRNVIQLSDAANALIAKQTAIDHQAPAGSMNGPRIARTTAAIPTPAVNNSPSAAQSSEKGMPKADNARAKVGWRGKSLAASNSHAIATDEAIRTCKRSEEHTSELQSRL